MIDAGIASVVVNNGGVHQAWNGTICRDEVGIQ